MDEPIVFYNVHRNLAETVYLIRFYFIRLTEFDVLLVTAAGLLTWIMIDGLGMAQQRVWIFTLDPFGYFASAIATALILILSLAHRFRPEGGVEQIARGYAGKTLLAPRTRSGDRLWRASHRICIEPDERHKSSTAKRSVR
jgi:hypothetical protein